MADTKSMYVRVQTSLRDQISEFAKSHGMTMSEGICDLVENGLLHKELSQRLDVMSSENQNLKIKNERIQGELLQVKSQLNIAQNSIRGLRSYIQTRVAQCKSCNTQMSLQDLVIRMCPNCGGSSFDLLDEYKGQVTGLQAIERILTLVGGIYIASQILGDND